MSAEEIREYFNSDEFLEAKEIAGNSIKKMNIIFDKAEKLDQILEMFQNQPDSVIQWTPTKNQYSWGFPTRTRAAKLLEDILTVITSEKRTSENQE